MASEKTLNAKNLAALGAERLAELLLELATADAAAKRRLRLELASRSGSGDVAAEIRKRLTAIAKSRSFVDWRKIRALAQDLDIQRAAIVAHVAPAAPSEAFDLLWRLLGMAPALSTRCDDSNGTIGTIIGMARTDLGTVAGPAKLDPGQLADRVFQGVCANDYGQFDGLIGLMADAMGQDGLGFLKAKFEELATRPPTRANDDDRRVIGMSTRGPIYEDEYEIRRHASLCQSALTEIADALDDVDGYAARFQPRNAATPPSPVASPNGCWRPTGPRMP